MKRVLLLHVTGMALVAMAQAAGHPSLQATKSGPAVPNVPLPILQGGDNASTATMINALPYTDSGTTEGFTDDYSECTIDSPDVVYVYIPTHAEDITVSLCGSGYDTALMVYEGSLVPGSDLACNDDFCGLSSEVQVTGLTAGMPYYIVVDGYGGHYGAYTLNVTGTGGADPEGETFETAMPVPGLPYSHSHSTSGFRKDYPTCVSGTSPDVVYAFTPDYDMDLDLSLCGSGFDTALSVFNAAAPDFLVACNDDACGTRSLLEDVPVLGGALYYIVVGGYGSAQGNYTLALSTETPLPDPCAGAISEGEGYYTGDDTVNGGCNFEVPPFSQATCGTYCGSVFTFTHDNGGSYRDLDWYQFTLDTDAEVVVTAECDAPISLFLASGSCGDLGIVSSLSGTGVVQVSGSSLPAGDYLFIITTRDFTGVPEEAPYRVTLASDGCADEVGAHEQPAAFALGNAVPNPFNPSTEIAFSLAENGPARLTVHDVAGRQVATLVDGALERGSHTVRFDGRGLSSGVYFYTLEADGLSQTHKMVLMK